MKKTVTFLIIILVSFSFIYSFFKIKDFIKQKNEYSDKVVIEINSQKTKDKINNNIEIKQDKYIELDKLSPKTYENNYAENNLPQNNNDKIKISIVIDDSGNSLKNIDEYFMLAKKYNITFAVMPDSLHKDEFIKKANEMGINIMLHMPMEAENISFGERHIIKTNMNEEEIFIMLDNAFNSIPTANGLNNHTGSLVTSDTNTVKLILKYLKENDKYFLDSLTTSKSTVYTLAKDYGVKTIKRDIFLDNEQTKENIKKEWEHLIKKAKRNNVAIAISHYNSEETLNFLKNNLPKLKADDIITVKIDEVLH